MKAPRRLSRWAFSAGRDDLAPNTTATRSPPCWTPPPKASWPLYFERISQPIELIASLDDSSGAADIRELLTEIAAIAPEKITARFDGNFARKPSFQITRVGHDMGVHFAALPMGHEFTSLLLALLWAGGHPPKSSPGDRADQGLGR